MSREPPGIPVLYQDCRIPFRLGRFQYVDFRSDYDAGLRALMTALAAQHQAPPGPPGETTEGGHNHPRRDGQAKGARFLQAPPILIWLAVPAVPGSEA